MQVENPAPHGYAALIAKATGAPDAALPILEEIMRGEIFHSTLDWQSPAEFRRGARKAYQLYVADKAFYDANARWRRAVFRASLAEQTLAQLLQQPPAAKSLAAAEAALESARFEEAAARASLDEVS